MCSCELSRLVFKGLEANSYATRYSLRFCPSNLNIDTGRWAAAYTHGYLVTCRKQGYTPCKPQHGAQGSLPGWHADPAGVWLCRIRVWLPTLPVDGATRGPAASGDDPRYDRQRATVVLAGRPSLMLSTSQSVNTASSVSHHTNRVPCTTSQSAGCRNTHIFSFPLGLPPSPCTKPPTAATAPPASCGCAPSCWTRGAIRWWHLLHGRPDACLPDAWRWLCRSWRKWCCRGTARSAPGWLARWVARAATDQCCVSAAAQASCRRQQHIGASFGTVTADCHSYCCCCTFAGC